MTVTIPLSFSSSSSYCLNTNKILGNCSSDLHQPIVIHSHNTYTCIHANTCTQVCFWVVCLPLRSFLQFLVQTELLPLSRNSNADAHETALTAVKWSTINKEKKTFPKEKQKICSQNYFSTELDLFLFKVNHSHKMFPYLTVKRHEVMKYNAILKQSLPILLHPYIV